VKVAEYGKIVFKTIGIPIVGHKFVKFLIFFTKILLIIVSVFFNFIGKKFHWSPTGTFVSLLTVV